MENILLVNLEGTDSLFTMGQLIKSISANNPDSNISLLVFENDLNAVRLIPGVKDIFTIRSEEIKKYFNSALFSDALGINLLLETILEMENRSWDRIIHFGESEFGKYISSYLDLKNINGNFIGQKIDEFKKTIAVDKWHKISGALNSYPFYPLNNLEVFHLSLGINLELPSSPQKLEAPTDIKVGIQIPGDMEDKNLPFEGLIELIDLLKTDLNYFPILLFDPENQNREYAEKINRYFDNELEIITTNYLNLTKLLPILDSIITAKSNIKNLAQQMGIPIIEVIGHKDHLERDWTPGKHDLSLVLNDRIRGEDLYNALTKQFDFLDPNICVYRSCKDNLGIRPVQIKGPKTPELDIPFLLSRYLIGRLYLNSTDPEIFTEVVNNFSNDLPDWVMEEKEAITNVSKIILNALRFLKQVAKKNENLEDFITSIDELLAFSGSKNLVSIPLLSFKYSTDLIPKESFNENIKYFEELIYDLKEGVKGTLSTIKDLENNLWVSKKKTLMEKSQRNKVLPLNEPTA